MKTAIDHLKDWIAEWYHHGYIGNDDLKIIERVEFVEKEARLLFNYETGEWSPIQEIDPSEFIFKMCVYGDDVNSENCYVYVEDMEDSNLNVKSIVKLFNTFGFTENGPNIFSLPPEISYCHAPMLLKALGLKQGEDVILKRDISHG